MRTVSVVMVVLAFIMVPAWTFHSRFGSYAASVTIPIGLPLLLFQVILTVSVSRSIQFWRRSSSDARVPKKLSLLFDFFLIASIARSDRAYRFWHLWWGPVWEVIPITRAFRSRYARGRFVAMHEFRLDAAKGLWKQLFALQEELDQLPSDDLPVKESLDHDFVDLCRELWAVTGQDLFRQIERRGEILATDLQTPTIRLLSTDKHAYWTTPRTDRPSRPVKGLTP